MVWEKLASNSHVQYEMKLPPRNCSMLKGLYLHKLCKQHYFGVKRSHWRTIRPDILTLEPALFPEATQWRIYLTDELIVDKELDTTGQPIEFIQVEVGGIVTGRVNPIYKQKLRLSVKYNVRIYIVYLIFPMSQLPFTTVNALNF